MIRFEPSRLVAPAFALALGLLAAGNAHAINHCGDNFCSSTGFPVENEFTCPEDCGGTNNDCNSDVCDDCERPPFGDDKDSDGIKDRLEHDLAHRYFPHLKLQHADIDRHESYMFRGFSIPYTASEYRGDGPLCDQDRECIEIRYGIAFFEDHGDLCGLFSHSGDSEMYAILVRRIESYGGVEYDWRKWLMIRDFTAAHWGTASDSSKVGAYGFCPTACQTMSSDASACGEATGCRYLGFCSGLGGVCPGQSKSFCDATPVCHWSGACRKSTSWTCYEPAPRNSPTTIFAAEGKHALYHTDSECDGGGFVNSDSCPTNDFNMRDVRPGNLQNVGNADSHDSNDVWIEHPTRCKLYDVWGGKRFGGASSYLHHFTAPIDWLVD